MTKGLLFVAFLLVAMVPSSARRCNETMANYLSPHSLGKQDEMTDALAILCKQVKIPTTRYQYGSTNYSLYNVSVKCLYNDGKQRADVVSGDVIEVTGGVIEFQLNFNYTISRIGPDKPGWAYASVFSDTINFQKEIALDSQSHPTWHLLKANPINIVDKFKIKRIEPKPSEDDLSALDQAINSAISAITPANIRNQIHDLVNDNFTSVLNQTLKEIVMGNKIKYSFHHPHQGELDLNFTSELYNFNITPSEGFELYYTTIIEGWNEDDCLHDIPVEHENYTIYGGIQTALSFDLIRQVVLTNIRKGWFNTHLNSEWETPAFQFFAGDVYYIIPMTQTLPARTGLTGACNATEDNFTTVTRFNDSTLSVNLDFKCRLNTNDMTGTQIADFEVATNFRVKVTPQYESLEFTIIDVIGIPHFNSVGGYIVEDIEQAKWKVNMALRSLRGMRVFGSGFPIWPRDLPDIRIFDDHLFVYDESQIPHKQPKE